MNSRNINSNVKDIMSGALHSNTEVKHRKYQTKLALITELNQVVNGWQSIVFRLVVLLFVVGVEVMLFIAVFKGKQIDGAVITAITIIAILPILVMRAFDITALSLTKEGISSTMADNEQVNVDDLAGGSSNGVHTPVKLIIKESTETVKAKTDKYCEIDFDGKVYKLAIVE